MRVAIFLPSLGGGGAEKVMVNLASNFCDRGLTVDLVLARREGPYLSHVPENVSVVDLGAGRVITSLVALIRYLRQKQPDVLLSAMDHSNIVALWASKLSRVTVRVVISVRSTMSMRTKNTKGRSRLIPHLAKYFYGWADSVVAVSQGVAEDLSETTGLRLDRITVIYNSVDVATIADMAKEQIEHPWFREGAPPVMLGVGRLSEAKDYPNLIRAFARVSAALPARLMILGEGEERTGLESLVQELQLEDVVSMPGYSKNPYAYMSRAAVFVLSSAWEGLPNVLLEAMACGTKIVSTNCRSGPAEILRNGTFGRLVPIRDSGALAEGIIAALDDASSREVLRRRATEFSDCDIADQYLEVLKVRG